MIQMLFAPNIEKRKGLVLLPDRAQVNGIVLGCQRLKFGRGFSIQYLALFDRHPVICLDDQQWHRVLPRLILVCIHNLLLQFLDLEHCHLDLLILLLLLRIEP